MSAFQAIRVSPAHHGEVPMDNPPCQASDTRGSDEPIDVSMRRAAAVGYVAGRRRSQRTAEASSAAGSVACWREENPELCCVTARRTPSRAISAYSDVIRAAVTATRRLRAPPRSVPGSLVPGSASIP
jgi:hypothetical protein